MAYIYWGSDHAVAGTAVTLDVVDTLYIDEDAHVGSTDSGFGVLANGDNHVTILGTLFSVGGMAYFSSDDNNRIVIGADGSLGAGSYGIDLSSSSNEIVNAGSIAGNVGVQLDGDANRLTNSGNIEAALAAVSLSGADGHLTNTGTIVSTGNGVVSLTSVASATINVDNSGTIATSAGVVAIADHGVGVVNLLNSGIIQGGILFAGHDDLYDGATGSVSGPVSGAGGDDRIFTGAGRDTLIGGAGSDILDSGEGRDVFQYGKAKESGGKQHDTVFGFDPHKDVFDVKGDVTGIDGTVAQGQLRGDHFASDMEAAIGPGKLTANHAVLFKPDGGSLAGHTILVVDNDGNAGFQANKDYVFDLKDADNLGALSVDTFI